MIRHICFVLMLPTAVVCCLFLAIVCLFLAICAFFGNILFGYGNSRSVVQAVTLALCGVTVKEGT